MEDFFRFLDFLRESIVKQASPSVVGSGYDLLTSIARSKIGTKLFPYIEKYNFREDEEVDLEKIDLMRFSYLLMKGVLKTSIAVAGLYFLSPFFPELFISALYSTIYYSAINNELDSRFFFNSLKICGSFFMLMEDGVLDIAVSTKKPLNMLGKAFDSEIKSDFKVESILKKTLERSIELPGVLLSVLNYNFINVAEKVTKAIEHMENYKKEKKIIEPEDRKENKENEPVNEESKRRKIKFKKKETPKAKVAARKKTSSSKGIKKRRNTIRRKVLKKTSRSDHV